jgi:hypothetical protein
VVRRYRPKPKHKTQRQMQTQKHRTSEKVLSKLTRSFKENMWQPEYRHPDGSKLEPGQTITQEEWSQLKTVDNWTPENQKKQFEIWSEESPELRLKIYKEDNNWQALIIGHPAKTQWLIRDQQTLASVLQKAGQAMQWVGEHEAAKTKSTERNRTVSVR